MEIYRDDTTKSANLEIIDAEEITAIITRGGQDLELDIDATSGSFDIPFDVVAYDGPFIIEWSFTLNGKDYTRHEQHEVVTPYITSDSLDGEEVDVSSERFVRLLINTICRQTFGYYQGIRTILGEGGGTLSLPERLISLTGIGYNNEITLSLPSAYYNVTGDGWYLTNRSPGFDVYPYLGIDGVINEAGVIYDPYNPQVYNFQPAATYILTGVWGYAAVPEEVKEAAIILYDMYNCKDSVYRDRYLRAVKAADYRYDFHDKAWMGTGSASADALLAPYIKEVGWVVI